MFVLVLAGMLLVLMSFSANDVSTMVLLVLLRVVLLHLHQLLLLALLTVLVLVVVLLVLVSFLSNDVTAMVLLVLVRVVLLQLLPSWPGTAVSH